MSKIKKKNITIKILAVFIAILLWSYVRSEVNPNIVREIKNIDVDIVNETLINDEGLVISQNEELKVSVKISGRRSDLNSIKQKEILAEIDLSGATRGSQKIPIEVSAPFNVEIVDLSKRYINVEIDSLNKVSKEVKLNAIRTSTDDIIETSDISPKTVEVSGPSGLVKQVSEVIVDIDINNISSTGKMKLPVKAVDKKGVEIKGVETRPDIVDVTVSLKKEKKVSIKPRYTGTLGEEYKLNAISSKPKSIVIIGTEADLKNIDTIETENIDISGLKEDKTFKAKLVVPKGLTVEGGQSEVILSVDISSNAKITEGKKESDNTEKKEDENVQGVENQQTENREIKLSSEKISLIGLSDGYLASMVDAAKEVSINLTADPDTLKGITETDIALSLNLTGIQEGTYELNLEASIAKGIIMDINPKTIKVKVEQTEKIDNTEKVEQTE